MKKITPYVYIVRYGEQIELVARTIQAPYQFLKIAIPEFLHRNIKSYPQIARDLKKGKTVVVSLPNRYPYTIQRYLCVKNYNRELSWTQELKG